jgi:hypothetical protein
VFALFPGQAESGGDEVCVKGDASCVAAHVDVSTLNCFSEHFEKFDRSRPTDPGTTGLRSENGFGQDGSQAFLGKRAGVEFFEYDRGIPVAPEDATDEIGRAHV